MDHNQNKTNEFGQDDLKKSIDNRSSSQGSQESINENKKEFKAEVENNLQSTNIDEYQIIQVQAYAQSKKK